MVPRFLQGCIRENLWLFLRVEEDYVIPYVHLPILTRNIVKVSAASYSIFMPCNGSFKPVLRWHIKPCFLWTQFYKSWDFNEHSWALWNTEPPLLNMLENSSHQSMRVYMVAMLMPKPAPLLKHQCIGNQKI